MNIHECDELSDAELDRILRLADAASAAPWSSSVVGRDAYADCNCIELGLCNELGSFARIELIGGSVADQDFIASARQDVLRLLREVRTLRARLNCVVAGPAPLHPTPMSSDPERSRSWMLP
jgi:hypothetical protein